MDRQALFQAWVVEEAADGQVARRLAARRVDDLPDGEVLVRVLYSSLNYKDALSASGNKGVTRRYPHTPGIDAAGLVVESASPGFQPGDAVISLTGDLGANWPGGFGQMIRVPAGWLLPLPRGLTLKQAMIYGTAGFTAALCVARLVQAGVHPEQGEVLVTGATGGVGSIAVGILAKEGFQVAAATGKTESGDMLRALGASSVLARGDIDDRSGRPMLHARWAGVVDTLGGNYLATAIRSSLPGGCVAACGNAASSDLPLSVFPFILRGVSLLGIDATRTPSPERQRLWALLAGPWKLERLDTLAREVPLDALDAEIERMLQGRQAGRVVINLE